MYSKCRANTDDRVYDFSGCPEGSVINITSATVGWSREWKEYGGRWVCHVDEARCRTPTNSPEIMQCNGRLRCNLTVDAFNYPGTFRCWSGGSSYRKGRYIVIRYNCIDGKRIWTCFCDLVIGNFRPMAKQRITVVHSSETKHTDRNGHKTSVSSRWLETISHPP